MLEVQFPPINPVAIEGFLNQQFPIIEGKANIRKPFFSSPEMQMMTVIINGQQFETDLWDSEGGLLFQSSFEYVPDWEIVREPGFWSICYSGMTEVIADPAVELNDMLGTNFDEISVDQNSIMLSISDESSFLTAFISEVEGKAVIRIVTEVFEIPAEVAFREHTQRRTLRAVK